MLSLLWVIVSICSICVHALHLFWKVLTVGILPTEQYMLKGVTIKSETIWVNKWLKYNNIFKQVVQNLFHFLIMMMIFTVQQTIKH